MLEEKMNRKEIIESCETDQAETVSKPIEKKGKQSRDGSKETSEPPWNIKLEPLDCLNSSIQNERWKENVSRDLFSVFARVFFVKSDNFRVSKKSFSIMYKTFLPCRFRVLLKSQKVTNSLKKELGISKSYEMSRTSSYVGLKWNSKDHILANPEYQSFLNNIKILRTSYPCHEHSDFFCNCEVCLNDQKQIDHEHSADNLEPHYHTIQKVTLKRGSATTETDQDGGGYFNNYSKKQKVNSSNNSNNNNSNNNTNNNNNNEVHFIENGGREIAEDQFDSHFQLPKEVYPRITLPYTTNSYPSKTTSELNNLNVLHEVSRRRDGNFVITHALPFGMTKLSNFEYKVERYHCKAFLTYDLECSISNKYFVYGKQAGVIYKRMQVQLPVEIDASFLKKQIAEENLNISETMEGAIAILLTVVNNANEDFARDFESYPNDVLLREQCSCSMETNLERKKESIQMKLKAIEHAIEHEETILKSESKKAREILEERKERAKNQYLKIGKKFKFPEFASVCYECSSKLIEEETIDCIICSARLCLKCSELGGLLHVKGINEVILRCPGVCRFF